MASKKPNLVIFMPDQLRYDSLSCTSNPQTTFLKTPNIASFAARGTLFTNCFTQASVCSQSRCSMFTGTYPHVSGHRSLENLIKPWEPNLFRSLKENGYHVACLAPRGDTFAPTVTELSVDEYGFLETPDFVPRFSGDRSSNLKDESIWGRLFYKGLRNAAEASDYDDAVVRSALRWLECPPQDKPWVLFMPLIFPHCPFQVEEPYFSLYDRDIIRSLGLRRGRKQGLWDETITMFFTDHGEYLGDHGLIEKWPSGLSDSLVHEPLIIAGGGLPQGQVYTGMAEMVDLVPTVLELCGIPEQFPHNGRSLVPVLRDPSLPHKQYAFSEGGFLTAEEPLLEQAPYPYDIKAALQHEDTTLVGKAVSIRSLEWTFVYRLYEPAELYHRQRDPEEMHNLAAEPKYVPVARMLEAEVLRWLVESSDFLPWTKDARFPEVKLKSPREQLEERLRTKDSGESI
ncbi:arylsulfatase [Aspergillus bombycis]|uniref:Arylsulfatase n=1 Tax=Aspergillus bombycis TaxID=109264 RepID=A0A1F8AHS6_9EURO|nr:arylsulfatase [Aspergillus bombycis]OGM51276.1 arylsulfatase [Aspergillus bombycis]